MFNFINCFRTLRFSNYLLHFHSNNNFFIVYLMQVDMLLLERELPISPSGCFSKLYRLFNYGCFCCVLFAIFIYSCFALFCSFRRLSLVCTFFFACMRVPYCKVGNLRNYIDSIPKHAHTQVSCAI